MFPRTSFGEERRKTLVSARAGVYDATVSLKVGLQQVLEQGGRKAYA